MGIHFKASKGVLTYLTFSCTFQMISEYLHPLCHISCRPFTVVGLTSNNRIGNFLINSIDQHGGRYGCGSCSSCEG